MAIGLMISSKVTNQELRATAATGEYVINFWTPANLSDTGTSTVIDLSYVNGYSEPDITSVSSVTRTYQKRKGGIGIGSSNTPSGGFTLVFPTQITSVDVYATNWTGTEAPLLSVGGQTAKTVNIQNSTITAETNIDDLTPYNFTFTSTNSVTFSSTTKRLVIYQIVANPTSATGTISVTNSNERVLNGTSLVITPTLGGTGILTAFIGDDTIASLVTTPTSVTVNTLKVGTTDITLSYGGSSVKVALEVYEPVLNFNKTSLKLLPETVGTVTATPIDFSPTSYSWTKVDSNGVIILSNTTSATVTVTATTTLGSATLTVEATDGTTIKQKSLIVTVSEIAEGKYTLSSNATVYTNPMLTSQFDIVKSNVESSDIVISDISDTRAYASPHTGHIMIGGGASTGGSFKVTLPEGLFASSIKFSGLQVDSGKTPTLSINNGVSFKYASGMTEATLKSYSNVLTIATSPSRIWVSSIEIEAKTATNAALDFGAYFLATTDAECAASNVQLSTWNKLQSSYSSMDDEVKEVVDSTSINNIGNDLEKAIGRYQVIRTVYGYTGFIGGGSSPLGKSLATKNNEIGLIMIISILGLTSLVGYYFFRKKSLN